MGRGVVVLCEALTRDRHAELLGIVLRGHRCDG